MGKNWLLKIPEFRSALAKAIFRLPESHPGTVSPPWEIPAALSQPGAVSLKSLAAPVSFLWQHTMLDSYPLGSSPFADDDPTYVWGTPSPHIHGHAARHQQSCFSWTYAWVYPYAMPLHCSMEKSDSIPKAVYPHMKGRSSSSRNTFTRTPPAYGVHPNDRRNEDGRPL